MFQIILFQAKEFDIQKRFNMAPLENLELAKCILIIIQIPKFVNKIDKLQK